MEIKARQATQKYHKELYKKYGLFQKRSSWLEKPHDEIIDILKRYFIHKKSVRVLDFGSGVGRNAIPIAKLLKGNKGIIYCVDYLKIAIDKLNKYAKEHGVSGCIKGFISSIEDYKIKDNFYDYIIAHSVLTHTKNKSTMFRIIRDMMKGTKNNGIIYIYEITNPKMRDAKSGKKINPEAEIDISYEEFKNRLKQMFFGWDILALSKNPYKERYLKDGREVIWESDYLFFVVQKHY